MLRGYADMFDKLMRQQMTESIFETNRDTIKDILSVDDKAVDMLAFEASRLKRQTRIGKHPFLFHGLLSIITSIMYPFKGLRQRVVLGNDDFVLVSCPDTVFRTESIGLIAGDLKYSIIYLPNFHISSAIQYNRYFTSKGIKVFFPTIKIGHIFVAWRTMRHLYKQMVWVGIENTRKKIIQGVLSSFVIYDQVVKNYMHGAKSFDGKWLLEHDKFYFMASVINLHQSGKKCTMLQHGIFFRPSFNFIPLFCDNVLCCSNREKSIYIENGVSEERIKVFGAPLQTLRRVDNRLIIEKHYDLLVMMTYIKETNVDLIREVLLYIKQNYTRVLVRMRPRSRKADKAYLDDYLDGMTISMPGTPIDEDIICSDKVVSFSEDANVEIAKMHKPFVIVWAEEVRAPQSMVKCATRENYKEEIKKLMTQDFYSSYSQEQYREVLGETDIDILRKRFEEYIRR